jgi:hypothetical protein
MSPQGGYAVCAHRFHTLDFFGGPDSVPTYIELD